MSRRASALVRLTLALGHPALRRRFETDDVACRLAISQHVDNFDPGSKLDITYEESRKRLADALSDLPTVMENLQNELNALGPENMVEALMLDNEGGEDDEGLEGLFAMEAAELPKSVPLDALTVVDDDLHFDRIEAVKHFPKHLIKLREMY